MTPVNTQMHNRGHRNGQIIGKNDGQAGFLGFFRDFLQQQRESLSALFFSEIVTFVQSMICVDDFAISAQQFLKPRLDVLFAHAVNVGVDVEVLGALNR